MYEQVSAVLEEAIGNLEIPVDGAALTHCFALFDRFEAKLTNGVGRFDRADAWRDTGSTSMTNWLRNHTSRSGRDAASCVRTAKRLGELPEVAAAYEDGRLSTGQVQAIVVNLNDKTAPLFAEQEEELLPTLVGLSVADLTTVMQAWASRAKDQIDDREPPAHERSLHVSKTLDGRREVSGSLDPEGGLVLETALRVAARDDLEGEAKRTPAEKRADALIDALRFFLDHQDITDGGRHRPHLNVFTDYEDFRPEGPGQGGWAPDGTRVDQATLQRLMCDAGINRIVRQGKSVILDYGTTTRNISPALWAALVARDRHCRFPGCDCPPQYCEAHHVNHVEHGGETNLGNTVLACFRNHKMLHEPGWSAKLLPDGTLEVTTPQGQTLTSHPPSQLPDLYNPRPPP